MLSSKRAQLVQFILEVVVICMTMSAEGKLWQEECLPSSGMVQAGASCQLARWISHMQSWGSAEERKQPLEALLKSDEEMEYCADMAV